MSQERRRHARTQVSVPVQIESPSRRRVAVSRDLSRGGALLLSDSRFEIGEPIRLMLCLSRSPTEDLPVHGRVVRVEPSGPDQAWRYVLAISFDPELVDDPARCAGNA